MSDKPESAFPSVGLTYHDPGMSLRDYFAAKAMESYIVSPTTSTEAADNPEECAAWAYEQADEMLKARAK